MRKCRSTAGRRLIVPVVGMVRVIKPDGSVDEWGPNAAYEAGKDYSLRIILFEPRPNGLHHATTAKIYQGDEWRHVEGGPER